jgi:hypothetical protein
VDAEQQKPPTSYGFFGSDEFNLNRREILEAYFYAKKGAANRPVKTEHGPAAEARFRAWLERTLPKKFGVTSGYVIPNLMAPKFPLEHFDVIIYDALEAPILFMHENEDMSEQGRRRAIPARYVRAVYEVKATLTRKMARDAMEKLAHLTPFHQQFVDPFHTGIVFFELPDNHEKKNTILSGFVPPHVYHFTGALVLHASNNPLASALLSVQPRSVLNPDDATVARFNAEAPVSKDVDTLDIYLDSSGKTVMAEAGASAMFLFWQGVWHVSTTYNAVWIDDDYRVELGWSKNAFARFFLDLLSRLNGEASQPKDPKDTGHVFGQVFDVLRTRVSSQP